MRISSPLSASALLAFSLVFSSCNKQAIDPTPVAETAKPVADVELRRGTMQSQGGVPSSGTVTLVRDAANVEYVRFEADFRTDFHTGSLGVYLAKSDGLVRVQRAADPANAVRVGTITKDGAQALAIAGSAAGFTHIIIHCDPAMYNFGAAQLQ